MQWGWHRSRAQAHGSCARHKLWPLTTAHLLPTTTYFNRLATVPKSKFDWYMAHHMSTFCEAKEWEEIISLMLMWVWRFLANKDFNIQHLCIRKLVTKFVSPCSIDLWEIYVTNINLKWLIVSKIRHNKTFSHLVSRFSIKLFGVLLLQLTTPKWSDAIQYKLT